MVRVQVTYSLVANGSDSQFFVVDRSTGQVHLNVVDRLDHLINRSFTLYIAATDQGQPPLSAVAALRVILPAEVPPPSEYREPEGDSRLVVLGGVLASFFVVVVVIGIAIIIVVCRKSRRDQKPQASSSFWPRIQMELKAESAAAEGVPATVSTSTISPTREGARETDDGRTLNFSSLTRLDHFQRHKVGTVYKNFTSPSRGSAQNTKIENKTTIVVAA